LHIKSRVEVAVSDIIIPMKAPRRIYASWLPPNPRERAALVQLRRRQNIVIAWLVGLLPAGWIAAIVTRSDALLAPITVFWIVAGVTLAQRVAVIGCPRCGEKFCAEQALPYWTALISRRCGNCGLTLNPKRDST
jgi:hypothetical protein